MPLGTEDDVWQIDPVTARVRPDAALHDPVLIVVETSPGLASNAADICDFLRIKMLTVQDPRDIAEHLGAMQPVAVLHEADTMDCAVYDLMMVVAGLDRALPVMLVLPDDPQNRGAIDATQRLWQLTDVVPVHHRPGIRTLIEFLFRAGRRFGRTGPMPVSSGPVSAEETAHTPHGSPPPQPSAQTAPLPGAAPPLTGPPDPPRASAAPRAPVPAHHRH